MCDNLSKQNMYVFIYLVQTGEELMISWEEVRNLAILLVSFLLSYGEHYSYGEMIGLLNILFLTSGLLLGGKISLPLKGEFLL